MRRLAFASALVILVAVVVGSAAASSGSLVMAPVAASGSSPLASPPCSATPGTGSTLQPTPELFPSSEVEPWVDVSPVDRDVVAGLYQQDRWSNGGARDNVASISFDGGSRSPSPG
jgi:hypothetical protein